MKAKLTSIRPRDAALFTLVAVAIVASASLGACKAGVGDAPVAAGPEQSVPLQSDASASAQQDLTLTLSAPATCETEKGQGYGIDEEVFDEDGNFVRVERKFVAWYGVQEFSVSWSVNGGTGPYRLTIDGESRDATGDYAGASGSGRVLCADTTVESFIDGPTFAFRADPQVDSGWKTVRAVVTDADGDTAEATVDVYVILDTGSPDVLLRRGRTYRVFGHLLTVPQGLDLRIGETSTGEGGTGAVSLDVEGSQPLARIWLDDTSFREVRRIVPNLTDLVRGAQAGIDLKTKFDELVESFGQLPSVERISP